MVGFSPCPQPVLESLSSSPTLSLHASVRPARPVPKLLLLLLGLLHWGSGEEFRQDGFVGLGLPPGGRHKASAGSRILGGGRGLDLHLLELCCISPQTEVLDLPLHFLSMGLLWVPGKDGLGEGPRQLTKS